MWWRTPLPTQACTRWPFVHPTCFWSFGNYFFEKLQFLNFLQIISQLINFCHQFNQTNILNIIHIYTKLSWSTLTTAKRHQLRIKKQAEGHQHSFWIRRNGSWIVWAHTNKPAGAGQTAAVVQECRNQCHKREGPGLPAPSLTNNIVHSKWMLHTLWPTILQSTWLLTFHYFFPFRHHCTGLVSKRPHLAFKWLNCWSDNPLLTVWILLHGYQHASTQYCNDITDRTWGWGEHSGRTWLLPFGNHFCNLLSSLMWQAGLFPLLFLFILFCSI